MRSSASGTNGKNRDVEQQAQTEAPQNPDRRQQSQDMTQQKQTEEEPACFCSMAVTLATSIRKRARGLLLTAPDEEVLLLTPCRDVHTVGMAHRLDIAFVDNTGRVLETYRNVGPFRRLRNRRAAAVVERFSSCASPWFAKDDRLILTQMEVEQKTQPEPCTLDLQQEQQVQQEDQEQQEEQEQQVQPLLCTQEVHA